MFRWSVLVCVILLLCPGIAFADWRLEEGFVAGPSCEVEGGECVRVATPCRGTSLAETATRVFVTCDSGGLLVVDTSSVPPRALEVRRMLEPVPAQSVKLVDGQVWVDTPLGSRPLEAFDRVAPPLPAPPIAPPVPTVAPAEPEPAPVVPSTDVGRPGSVVDVGTGWVIIDIGSEQGLKEDGFVEFLRVEDVDLGAGQVVSRERRLGVGQVDTLNEQRSRVVLGLNQRIPVGAIVRADPGGVTARKVLMTPPRPRGVWEVELNVRPFLALSTLGGGGIVDARIGRRFDGPLAIDAVLAPFGFGIARDGDILTFAGNVVVSYDTTAFQIGLGAGASRINTLPVGGTDYIRGADAVEPSFRVGFSAAQFVRLGSVDGVHIEVLNNFSLFEEEFVFGGITVSGQVPIRLFKDVAWIVAQGGGGVPGHVFGELGIRILARGNGGPGSVFLTPTVGAGILTGERWYDCDTPEPDNFGPRPVPTPSPGICRTEYDYGGPLVGFGAEWRF